MQVLDPSRRAQETARRGIPGAREVGRRRVGDDGREGAGALLPPTSVCFPLSLHNPRDICFCLPDSASSHTLVN